MNTTCPYCGSNKTISKGWRERAIDKGHILRCMDCGHYFTANTVRSKSAAIDLRKILSEFIVEGKTVRDLATRYSVSKSTIHRIILKTVDKSSSWEETTATWLENQRSLIGDWFKNLVVDTTSVEVEGEKFTYLHAADNHSKLPLVYRLLSTPHEDGELIKSELLKLRELVYEPNLATIDGSKALFYAIKRVYSNVPVQFCLVHLSKNLDEKLRIGENVPDQVLLDRERARNLIMHTAVADQHTRQTMLKELKQFANYCRDDNALKTVEGFLEKINSYHTLEELKRHPEALTTNLCENHIGQIKIGLRRKLFGFKSKENAQKYINVYWETYIKSRRKLDESTRNTDSLSFLLRGHIPLESLANLVVGVDYKSLVDIITKSGRLVITTEKGSYPITAWQIEK